LDRKIRYGSLFLDEIDWTKTRAFFAQDKGVWVNLVGREPQGWVSESSYDSVIEEARAALVDLKDFNGDQLFESVMTRNETFFGRWIERLPDLVMIPANDQYVYNERPSYGDPVVPADSTTGTHSRDGVFIAWGKGIRREATFSRQPQLRDVGPTALGSLGCPLTNEMDGRMLNEVFEEEVIESRIGSSYRELDGESKGSIYVGDEESEIRKRLRALGYID
jgi:predicted AlkP superfamily phosphohydrolase/phosphomutase